MQTPSAATPPGRHSWKTRLARQGITPEQFVFQFLIVAVGVWLAIVVGNRTTENDKRQRARDTLLSIRNELAQDKAELVDVISDQRTNLTALRKFAKLVRDPQTPDSVIRRVMFDEMGTNRTLFPRRAAYNVLIGSGQLADLEDPDLTLGLAELYEHHYVRIMNNGDLADEVFFAWRYGQLEYWDFERNTPVGGPALALKISNLAHRYQTFTTYYVRNLESLQRTIDAMLAGIDEYTGQ